MRIVTLIENRVSTRGLVAEHGLSFFIDTGSRKIVFDTGQSGLFADNASKLGVDLAAADALVISHGHYDHTGGMARFLEINMSAPVFLKKEAFQQKLHNEDFIGIDPIIDPQSKRFRFVDSMMQIDESIYIFPETRIFYPVDQHREGFFIQDKGNRVPDLLQDELFLVFLVEGALTVLSSCSHNGISNMVETARSYFGLPVKRVIGGFHIRKSGEALMNHLISYFNQSGVEALYTGHCTGIDQFFELKRNCGATVTYHETGFEIVF
ncbi:MAG TPA: MBL fold metallo-hydrolase [Prolixibacteraceae bacterium]|nr:MBL fold metallo-hydrolase [Prolixibacteraceae bacterium]